MLGYIVPCKGELKVREFEIYNAYYCAVCRAVKERYGQLPRLMLSFDSAFLAMLLEATEETEDCITEFRCAIHPWKKSNVHVGGAAVNYAADILVLLSYLHLEDDKRDEHRLRGFAGTLLYRRAFLKAAKRLPQKTEVMKSRLDALTSLEQAVPSLSSKQPAAREARGLCEHASLTSFDTYHDISHDISPDICQQQESFSIDEMAEPFARLMEEVMDGVGAGEDRARILRAVGYNLGKWIYLIDAADDYEKDKKTGAFNPLHYGNYSPERLGFTLEMCLSEAAKAFELLRLYKNEAILRNIIYVGLRLKTEEIIAEYGKITSEV